MYCVALWNPGKRRKDQCWGSLVAWIVGNPNLCRNLDVKYTILLCELVVILAIGYWNLRKFHSRDTWNASILSLVNVVSSYLKEAMASLTSLVNFWITTHVPNLMTAENLWYNFLIFAFFDDCFKQNWSWNKSKMTNFNMSIMYWKYPKRRSP